MGSILEIIGDHTLGFESTKAVVSELSVLTLMTFFSMNRNRGGSCFSFHGGA